MSAFVYLCSPKKISNLLQDVDDDSNVATKGIRKWI